MFHFLLFYLLNIWEEERTAISSITVKTFSANQVLMQIGISIHSIIISVRYYNSYLFVFYLCVWYKHPD